MKYLLTTLICFFVIGNSSWGASVFQPCTGLGIPLKVKMLNKCSKYAVKFQLSYLEKGSCVTKTIENIDVKASGSSVLKVIHSADRVLSVKLNALEGRILKETTNMNVPPYGVIISEVKLTCTFTCDDPINLHLDCYQSDPLNTPACKCKQ